MSERLLGRKRSFESEENTFISSNHPFTFVPPLSPGQKLFDQQHLSATFSPEHPWSPATLSHRFRRRRSNSAAKTLSPTPARSTTVMRPVSDPSAQDRQIPASWAMYVPVAYNALVALPILYVLFSVVYTFSNDFRIKAEEHQAAILQQVASCAKNYEINQCDPSSRVPALEDKCNFWESCLSRNPSVMSRSKIFAEIVAETLNSFVEPISYKAMLFFSVMIVGLFVVSNFTLATYYRKRSHLQYYHQYHHPSSAPPASLAATQS